VALDAALLALEVLVRLAVNIGALFIGAPAIISL
jgi:hypothetical protein